MVVTLNLGSNSNNNGLPAGLTAVNPNTGLTGTNGQPVYTNKDSTSVLGASTSQPSASATPAVDPAVQAKADAITNAISYGTQNAVAAGQAGTAGAVGSLTETGEPEVAAIKNQQDNINLARTQIGTSQINTIKQLMNTIRSGLQGSGVALGNTGALSSSARDAVGRAYANFGNTQKNTANNTAATANQAQDVQQGELVNTAAGYTASLRAARDQAVATIQGNAIAALNNLGTLVSVYLGGDASSINAPAIQAQIIQNAQDQLAKVDADLESRINGGIAPNSGDTTAANAMAASNAGVVPAAGNSFGLSGGGTNQVQAAGGAPAPSLIPLTVGKAQNDQPPGV